RPDIVEHFLKCPDDIALDFIEFSFKTLVSRTYLNSPLVVEGLKNDVDGINTVFREEGVGYDLTPFVFAPPKHPMPTPTQAPPPQAKNWPRRSGPAAAVYVPGRTAVAPKLSSGMMSPADLMYTTTTYPQIIKRTDQYAHEQVIKPALLALAH